MSVLESVKRIAEKTTGWRRPDNPEELLRKGKPHTHSFQDDGLVPNHPRWPLDTCADAEMLLATRIAAMTRADMIVIGMSLLAATTSEKAAALQATHQTSCRGLISRA